MSPHERSARRSWIILAVALLGLGALLALLLLWIHGAEATIAHQRARQQLTLVAGLVTAQLQHGEYQDAESLFASIAAADSSIDDLELTAANGFQLAAYHRAGVHPAVIEVSAPIVYSYRRAATLRLGEDLAPVYAREKSMALQLGGLYVAGSLLLALALRIALQRNAEAARLRGALGQLRATNRTLRVLSECNQALVRARSAAELMDSMCQILVEKGGFALAWIGMAESAGEKRVRSVAAYGAAGYLDGIDISWAEDKVSGNGPAGRAIRSGKPSVSRDVQAEPTAHPWKARAERFGFRCSIALPLGTDVPAYGLLSLYSSEPPLHFDEDETRLLTELASDLDYGLQSLRAEERRREVEQQVERQGKRFQALVEKSADAVAVIDAAGLLLYSGTSTHRPLGYEAAQVLGRALFDFVHPEDVAEVTKWFRACVAVDECSVEVTARARHKSGEWRWLDATFTNLLRDPAIGGIVVNFRDVTQRRDLQQRLLIEHQRSHVFLRKASDCLHILDAEGKLVDASDSFFAALGWARSELLGRDPSFWDAEYSGGARAPLIERVRAAGTLRFETRHRRKDGTVFDVEVVASYFQLAGAAYTHCSARDLTEVRKLEREVIGAATSEQRRLAYELHDALGQELTAARLLADTFAARAAAGSPESAAGFREVSAILARSLITARGIVTGLSPLAADQGDLAAGLARLAAASSTSSVQVRFTDLTDGLVVIPVDDRGHLFRIAQEAVQNALKHAAARYIDIGLAVDGEELQLTVADDGSGMAEPPAGAGGHGMYSMRFRCNAIGGRLFVGPRPQGGTLVACSVPNLARADASEEGRPWRAS